MVERSDTTGKRYWKNSDPEGVAESLLDHMSPSHESPKVTLVDMLAAICFVGPVAVGVVEGLDRGLIATIVGIALGLILGVLYAIGFKQSCIWVANHWIPAAESLSDFAQVIMGLLLLIVEFASVFCGIGLAKLIIHPIVRLVAAAQ
ncbi:MAG: hypothetical protein JWN70_5158 [Planctomycetaceae bacterium]|nr:hypothetical protein [Planctomycetaceae bacterium]